MPRVLTVVANLYPKPEKAGEVEGLLVRMAEAATP